MLTSIAFLALCLPQEPATAHETAVALLGTQHCDVAVSSTFTTEQEGSGGSAENYCQAIPGSHGFAASITYSGSLDLLDGTFGLACSDVPPVPASFGMFTYGTVQTNVPFANGYLCVSPFNPGIYRMTPQSLGTGSVASTMRDNPSEFALFQPGESWNFQFWYRDPSAGGAKFNLSNGLHVSFAPAL